MTSLRDAIQDTLFRYARGFDENDMDLIGSCFAEDATILDAAGEVVFSGRDTIRESFVPMRAKVQESGGQPRHLIVNIAVEPISDTEARAQAYFLYTMAQDGKISTLATGVYSDEYVKAGDDWLISRRQIRRDGQPAGVPQTASR